MLGRVGLLGLALALVLGASAARAMPDAAHGDISPTVPDARNLIDPRSDLAEPARLGMAGRPRTPGAGSVRSVL
jgi:hypothetical protein